MSKVALKSLLIGILHRCKALSLAVMGITLSALADTARLRNGLVSASLADHVVARVATAIVTADE